jgi:lysophospholipid acyltransferase (LPLAT)-like uncharacterized protein
VPLALAASAAWRASSWDGFLFPKPFATVRIEYLAPRFIGRDASREDLATHAAEIGGALDTATDRLTSLLRQRGREKA